MAVRGRGAAGGSPREAVLGPRTTQSPPMSPPDSGRSTFSARAGPVYTLPAVPNPRNRRNSLAVGAIREGLTPRPSPRVGLEGGEAGGAAAAKRNKRTTGRGRMVDL